MTYEAINPEDFGMSRVIDVAHRLVGRNAIREYAARQGLKLPQDVLNLATAQVKLMADEGPITLEDVDRILSKMMLALDD